MGLAGVGRMSSGVAVKGVVTAVTKSVVALALEQRFPPTVMRRMAPTRTGEGSVGEAGTG